MTVTGPPRPTGASPPQTLQTGSGLSVKKPAAQAADGRAALLALLKVEADARDAGSYRDLTLLIANETRKLTRARQIFVLSAGLTGRLEVQGISSLATVDRNSPLVSYIEQLVAASSARQGLALPLQLDRADSTDQATGDVYPFRALFWVPLQHGNRSPAGGIVLAREDAWNEQDLVIARRLASAYAHAWYALAAPKPRIKPWLRATRPWQAAAALTALAALVFIKVPLTALAPVEMTARSPMVVTAAIDGVIESIAVEPNQPVKPGDLLVKLTDTTLKSRLEVAERDAGVSQARLKQANQTAFDDPRGMHDIGIARAEMEVKLAERDYAREMLTKTEIRAQRAGLAVYSDKRELTGRPVAVGERILEVADPGLVEARISLPVADVIALAPGSRVKLFLDSDPLRPWQASVTRADYKARIVENDAVAFRIIAALEPDPARVLPRLGVRGTAQVSGADVRLGFYLFRRPIAAFRQWTGL